jgi:transcriptional regulator with XRE-family HTH domain
MSALSDLGEFIREQRRTAQISLRQLATLAGVSNPYLSQIERGLRKPSAEVLQQIGAALRISTPVMYLRAGLLEAMESGGVLAALAADQELNERQKQVLVEIYETFRRENAAARPAAETVATPDRDDNRPPHPPHDTSHGAARADHQ